MTLLKLKARERIVAYIVFLFLYFVYGLFAFHATPADSQWLFGAAVEGINQLAIDDAYRFFETRSAWHNTGLWSWAYLLPVDAFFKGLLHSITNSNVFLMRLGQIGVNILGVYALYRSCLLLGVRHVLALLTCISLLLMPLFMAVSMSFYGESLLGAMLAWAMYFYLSGSKKRFVLVASLAPLVQLQGLLLISGYFLYFLIRKNWRLFFLLALPGFLYFINVMIVHRSVFEFLSFTQLHKLYPALPVPIQERGWRGSFETFNPVLILFSVIGAGILWRRIWPFYIGVLLWFLLVATVMTHTNGYEPRYLYPCLPALYLALAVFLNTLWNKINKLAFKRGGAVVVLVALGLLTIENLGQSDPVRENYLGGKRWPIGEPHIGLRQFVTIKSNVKLHGQDLARRVESFVSENTDVKLLMINQHDIFYFLDRKEMPADVRVAYTPFQPLFAYAAFGGHFHALSPDHPQAAFYKFYSDAKRSQDKAIFIGDFSPLGLTADYQNYYFSVYELNYEITTPPERVNIIHRMEKDGANELHYKGKNLCPDEKDIFCPDWRKGIFLQ